MQVQTETQTTTEKLQSFCEYVQGVIHRAYPETYPESCKETVRFNQGKKNAKIILVDSKGKDRSVYCFVEIVSGKVMKAAGWSAVEPKRHERGNINDPSSWAAWIGPHGIGRMN